MIRKNITSFVASLVAMVCICSTAFAGQKFFVAASPETDSVVFESAAKLEFVDGKTSQIEGIIEFDPSNTAAGCTGRLRVDARTLKTGIELRDEHMRERHLQTDKFPYIEFIPKSTTGLPAQLVAGPAVKFEISGDFTVHGVTKAISAPATVEFIPSGATPDSKSMIVVATFDVKLDDYGIPRPKMLLLKLAETIKIRVRFVASTDNPAVVF